MKKNRRNKFSKGLLGDVGVALVLGAGGFKSAAHIGALEVLEENNIAIDLLVASGSASIVATMYSYYRSAKVVMDKLISTSPDDFFDIPWLNYFKLLRNSKGLCEGRNFQRMLIHQLPDVDLTHMKIPTILMATDMETFEEVEFSSGNVIMATLASTATPPFFSPVQYEGRMYLDGGISSPLPADIAKKYQPKLIIASNVSNHDVQYATKNMLEIGYRSLQITNFNLAIFQSKFADIVIDMGIDSSKHKHSAIYDMYLTGKRKTQKMLPEILLALEKKKMNKISNRKPKNKNSASVSRGKNDKKS